MQTIRTACKSLFAHCICCFTHRICIALEFHQGVSVLLTHRTFPMQLVPKRGTCPSVVQVRAMRKKQCLNSTFPQIHVCIIQQHCHQNGKQKKATADSLGKCRVPGTGSMTSARQPETVCGDKTPSRWLIKSVKSLHNDIFFSADLFKTINAIPVHPLQPSAFCRRAAGMQAPKRQRSLCRRQPTWRCRIRELANRPEGRHPHPLDLDVSARLVFSHVESHGNQRNMKANPCAAGNHTR